MKITMSNEMAKAVDQLFSQDPADEVAGSEKRGVAFVKSRSEAVGFPKGWYREELIRSGSGVVNPGHKIVHYHSPDGRKFRSKADLTRFFGHRLDLSNFDFKSGKMLPGYGASQKKNLNTAKSGAQKGLSGPVSALGSVSLQRFLDPPVRQCTCIYNQKVRAIETCGTNVCKDAKDIPRASGMKNLKPKPAQVFWSKRLEGFSARDVNEGRIDMSHLPRGFKAGSGILSDSAAVISLASSVFNASSQGSQAGSEQGPIFGQGEKFSKNLAFVNPYQPLVAHVKVTPELIEEQELQVQRLRRDLARLMGRPQKERI
ncbi:hypothetical protein RvY_15786 [Ramazzottius varieornatus]|uniref:MBD domain-containing protein n=1 Tax=Ramazzottius varieornatus TaxID=947166 RepID=A0A1D1W2U9_RAMVA|nr:hypothetical protein RvY_15786 [Ramazzottius varieornatus]